MTDSSVSILQSIHSQIQTLESCIWQGKIASIVGTTLTIQGITHHLVIGDHCIVTTKKNDQIPIEITGFDNQHAIAMALDHVRDVGPGCIVTKCTTETALYPSKSWVGRVLDGLGHPVDNGPPLVRGQIAYPLRSAPLPAFDRQRLETRIDLGIKSINSFLTCCKGQRMGIFSGSGIGKSTLLGMLARFTTADVVVLGLIGERGREVQEFLQRDLGEEGLRKSVVVVATSDEPAAKRRHAAYVTMAIAEYFRDQGLHVLCLIDSLTRFATAQREIGLANGEPPTSKGYTPSVFAELPKILERAGPGLRDQSGAITGLFTVLVDGDDHNEPITDAVRAILDGHIVLDRSIAERGRYPAVNILRSISRTVPDCLEPQEAVLINQARSILAAYNDMADLIRIGAYQKGSNPELDRAIDLYPKLEAFFAQTKDQSYDSAQSFQLLDQILKS